VFQISGSFFFSFLYLDASINTVSELWEASTESECHNTRANAHQDSRGKNASVCQSTLQLIRFLNQIGQNWNHLGSQYIFKMTSSPILCLLKLKDALCTSTQTISTIQTRWMPLNTLNRTSEHFRIAWDCYIILVTSRQGYRIQCFTAMSLGF